MAEHTNISWATHVFNPWIGCSKVHTGCENCYAEAMAGRLGVTWGPNGTRRRTPESTWKQVERWNRNASRRYMCDRCGGTGNQPDGHYDARTGRYDSPAGECCLCGGVGFLGQMNRPRVFPSLCDVFEDWGSGFFDSRGEHLVTPKYRTFAPECEDDWRSITADDLRRDFFALIDRTPNLDWLLLTKRPENVRRMWPENVRRMWPFIWCGHERVKSRCAPDRSNVWMLYSASDQATLESGLPHLLACRDLVQVIGLSLEPLVGPVDLSDCLGNQDADQDTSAHAIWRGELPGVDWVIVGGESGPNARPCNVEWIRLIVEQCKAAGVPCFVKQDFGPNPGLQGRIPDDLWAVKELPVVAV